MIYLEDPRLAIEFDALPTYDPRRVDDGTRERLTSKLLLSAYYYGERDQPQRHQHQQKQQKQQQLLLPTFKNRSTEKCGLEICQKKLD